MGGLGKEWKVQEKWEGGLRRGDEAEDTWEDADSQRAREESRRSAIIATFIRRLSKKGAAAHRGSKGAMRPWRGQDGSLMSEQRLVGCRRCLGEFGRKASLW
jgi:hypothetical protein